MTGSGVADSGSGVSVAVRVIVAVGTSLVSVAVAAIVVIAFGVSVSDGILVAASPVGILQADRTNNPMVNKEANWGNVVRMFALS
jgi:hypothetical protein